MRALLQTGFTPEEETGIIVGFCVVGFILLVLAAFGAFISNKVTKLEERLLQLENHPKLQKGDDDLGADD